MNTESVQNSFIIWLILAVCTVAGFAFGIYQLMKSKKKMQFAYLKKANTIIASGKSVIDGLGITYKGQTVDNLSVTKLAVWNCGNDVINQKEDIVTERPLKIVSGDSCTRILECNIIKESEATDKFEISRCTGDEAIISFDYAATKEGVIIQVIHTGESKNIYLDYKIKGGKRAKEIKNSGGYRTPKQKRQGLIIIVVDGIMSIVLIVCTVLGFIKPTMLADNRELQIYGQVMLSLMSAACIAIVVLSLSLFHLEMPAKLRELYDE